MNELKITGNITKIFEVQEGTSKAGKDWQKLNFIVEIDADYNNVFCFEVFGADKVADFNKWNKEGSKVTVKFNVMTREYKGKYYTNLNAWNVFNEFSDKVESSKNLELTEDLKEDEAEDDLPF